MIALVTLGSISQGSAQEDNTSKSNGGVAYEVTGSVKYLSIPTKILFINRNFLKSQIVDAYNLTQFRQNCTMPKQSILLRKIETKWWSQPMYKMEISGNNLIEGDIFIIPKTDISDKCNVQPRQFVIDRTIIGNMM